MASTVIQLYSETLTNEATTDGVWKSAEFDVSACDILILKFNPTAFSTPGYIALNRIDPQGDSDTMWASGINGDNLSPIWADVGACDSYSSSRAWGAKAQIVIGTTDPNETMFSGGLSLVGRGQS